MHALVRIPSYKPKKENSTRIEVRSPDSACNPYLAFAVIIAAGLKGIEEGYQLTSPDIAELFSPEASILEITRRYQKNNPNINEDVFYKKWISDYYTKG